MKVRAIVSEQQVEVLPVRVTKVEPGRLDTKLTAAGKLTADKELMVVSQTQGTVLEVRKSIGDQVRLGEVIVRVDNSLIAEEYDLTEAGYEKASKDLERAERLSEGDAITNQQLEGLRLNAQGAEAKLKASQKRLSDTEIKAPIAGLVNQVFTKTGAVLGPGAPVCEIVNIDRLSLVVKVTGKDIMKIEEGQQVEVRVDAYPGKSFNGTVVGFASKADFALRFPVEISLANSDQASLKAGLFAEAHFAFKDTIDGVVIPRQAIIGSIQDPSVYVVEDGKSKLKKVVPAFQFNDQVKILEGLQLGEQVIISGQLNLMDGAPVKIVE